MLFSGKRKPAKKKHSPINPFAFPAKTASSSEGGGGVLRQTDKSRCPKMRKSLPGLTETEAGRQGELEEKKSSRRQRLYHSEGGPMLNFATGCFPGKSFVSCFSPFFPESQWWQQQQQAVTGPGRRRPHPFDALI